MSQCEDCDSLFSNVELLNNHKYEEHPESYARQIFEKHKRAKFSKISKHSLINDNYVTLINISSFYMNPLASDVTLVSQDGFSYCAHKLILASASQFIKQLLLSEYPEEHVLIFLPDYSSQEIESFLKCVYGLEAEKEAEKADILLKEMEININQNLKPFCDIKDLKTKYKTWVKIAANKRKARKVKQEAITKEKFAKRSKSKQKIKEKPDFKHLKQSKDDENDFLTSFKKPNRKYLLFKSSTIPENVQFNPKDPTICPNCPYKNPKMDALKTHFRNNHIKKKCPECGKALTKYHFADHLAKQHGKSHLKRFQCEYCSEAFVYKSRLQYHMDTVHICEEKCICDICGLAMTSPATLAVHKSHKHYLKNVKYKCQDCHLEYSGLKPYKRHRQKYHPSSVAIEEEMRKNKYLVADPNTKAPYKLQCSNY